MDPHLYVTWRYLQVNDIIAFSSTCKELYQIVQEDETWRYLLWRDYKFEYKGADPKRKYYHLVEDMVIDWRQMINAKNYRAVDEIYRIAKFNLPSENDLFKQRVNALYMSLDTNRRLKWLMLREDSDFDRFASVFSGNINRTSVSDPILDYLKNLFVPLV